MASRYSDGLLRDLHSAVEQALRREGAINVPIIASELSARHGQENGVSLAELESQVMAVAMARNAVILFHRKVDTTGEEEPPPQPE